MPEHAFEILSEQLTRSLIGADFKGYCAVMELPLSILTRGGSSYVLHNEADLRIDFDSSTQELGAYSVTDIYRQSLSLDQLSPQSAVSTCLMHIMTKAQRLVDPFEARYHLHLTGEGWKFNRIERAGNSFVPCLSHAKAARPNHTPPTEDS